MRRLLAAVFCCLFASGACAAEFVFRYGHTQAEQHPRSQSMLFFKRELEARSGGRIQADVYFSGVLGTEREVMDMVTTGALQGTRGAFFVDANPKYAIFMLPFLTQNWEQARRLMYSEFTARINADAAARGFHIPACGISQGFRAHTNNVRPLRAPEDFKGMRLRVPPLEVFVRTASAFGANPQNIPFTETYQAIRTGVVDGQDNPPSNIWDYKIHEVQKYLSISNYATGPDPLIVNLQWYEGLPGELRGIFDETARAMIRYSDDINQRSEQDYIDKLARTMEVTYVDEANLNAFAELAKPVYQHFIDKGVFTWDDVEEARRIARGEAE